MLSKLYSWYGRSSVWGAAAAIVVLVVAGVALKFQSGEINETNTPLPIVKVSSVLALGGQESISLIGTVRAVSEAQIQSETGGRVTSVPVSLGQQVSAGQVIATVENAQQRASVLQAQGSYEAAAVNASVGDVSVAQAETALLSSKTNAIGTLQSSYTTVSNGFYSLIDQMYQNPNSALPSVYIAGGNGAFLRNERVAFQTILTEWQSDINSVSPNDDLQSLLTESIEYTSRTRDLVDIFIQAFQGRSSDTLNGTSIVVWTERFSALRAALDATVSALESAQTSLLSADEALDKAKLGGTQLEVSAANAQVKQALGALQAAQANLDKTIMRSPIAGTINQLNVNLGDYLSPSQPIAKVANNNALEVTVYVGANDLTKIAVGSEVLVAGEYVGIVTHVGAGIDTLTQKTEVKIATETTELTNGDTVTVSLGASESTGTESNNILLPISAVKFTADAGFVYIVTDNRLVEQAVTIGTVRGGYVEIEDGVTRDMEIVVDARGLTAGTAVETQQ